MDAKTFLDNFVTIAEARGGVARIRDLVLDLAVAGRLVLQDQSEEPAGNVLRRTARELKLERFQGRDLADTRSSEALPQGWEWAPLGTLGRTQTGSTPKKEALSNGGRRVSFIRPSDIEKGQLLHSGETVPVDSMRRDPVRGGAVLMVCIGSIGKTAISSEESFFNQQINSIEPVEVLPQYLWVVFQSSAFQKKCRAASSSTTISILNKGNWESLHVPVAPVSEQRRIVARVQELMILCNELVRLQQSRDLVGEHLAKAAVRSVTG